MFYNKQYITSPPNTTDQLINTCLQVNSTYHVWCIAYGVGSEWGAIDSRLGSLALVGRYSAPPTTCHNSTQAPWLMPWNSGTT
ncbi:hypothetical protein [Vulcanisaeta distributa]|uniref:hypothetical protein n=1 Tax=Vulcanisaeta distributa TaxID=164451 RepID=UPI001FB3742C|nr:hypothetical protein [Vulcanisaeta distributa]